MRINGYSAKILSNRKSIWWRIGDKFKSVGVDVNKRLTLKFIEGLLTDEGVDLAKVDYVKAYQARYVKYDLRHVMSTKSGEYNVWTKYIIKDGKLTKSVREIENKIY